MDIYGQIFKISLFIILLDLHSLDLDRHSVGLYREYIILGITAVFDTLFGIELRMLKDDIGEL